MPLLSDYARRKKIKYFLSRIPNHAAILEIGCGGGWVGDYLKQNGWDNYVGIDSTPPADVVGDIRNWQSLGLKPHSFDAIIGFEVVEHVDCFKECYELLKTGGELMLTSPLPHWDWVARVLEIVGLSQKRTSPHDRLIYFDQVPYFQKKNNKIVGLISQWGIFTKVA